jgi:nicotinamidase-related amidase
MATAKKIIAPSLLDPTNHALVMIDLQHPHLRTVGSHDSMSVIDATTLLAKGAKLFGVRTLLTTLLGGGQALMKEVREVFPEQEPIDRTTLNAFEDERVVAWAEAAGRGKLVLAGLWTESSLAMSALSALSAGYELYIVTDASGGESEEAHEMAVQRLLLAGATPLTARTYLRELQRDWARDATAAKVLAICGEHADSHGEGFQGEQPPVAWKGRTSKKGNST